MNTLPAFEPAALGHSPEHVSAPRRHPPDPRLRADTAAKQLLRPLLDSLRHHQPGVMAETDPEYLHDFRVALRRTRAVLSQVKAVFPERETRRHARKFAELGQLTGEPRDLDVYLLDFERQRAQLPEPWRADLDPLRELLRERAQASHARLNRYLASSAYRRWLSSWERFLALPPPQRPQARNAAVPIRNLADRRIWKLYRRLLADGLAIAPDSPAERLHDLRKTAKKLRYLMELFHSLYPPEKIDPLIKCLKNMQEQLGDYQDTCVQIAQLRQAAADLRQAGAPTGTLLALGALLHGLHAREQTLRDAFAGCFARFAKKSHRQAFRRLFKPAAAQTPAPENAA